jgi:hypothetical protein
MSPRLKACRAVGPGCAPRPEYFSGVFIWISIVLMEMFCQRVGMQTSYTWDGNDDFSITLIFNQNLCRVQANANQREPMHTKNKPVTYESPQAIRHKKTRRKRGGTHCNRLR